MSDLVPIEQKTVTFYDDELTAVRGSDGQVYVSIRQMCNVLGIKRPQRQTDRIKRDEVLSDGMERVPIMGTRGRQSTYVLRVDLVPLWLTGIEVSRVGDEIKDKIIRYKREVAKILWEAFQDGRLTADLDELLEQDTDAVQAYKMALAVVKLARNQILLEARVAGHYDQFTAIDQRLEQLETAVVEADAITQDQASQISQAVKTVAISLGKQTKRNEFGAVYGEMYRKFGITSYKLLPADQFRGAMDWLTEWHQSLVSDEF